MKNFTLVLLLLLASSLTTSVAVAGDNSFGVSWSSAIGTGNTSDFISAFQFRGLGIEYRKRVNSNVLWGLNTGYNVFAETGNETRYLDHAQLTGEWGKYINTIPIYLAAYYEFGPYNARSGRLYTAINAGTAYLEHRASLGLYALDEDNWHLAVAPEIGYKLPWDSFIGHLSVRYNYLFQSGAVEAQSWFEFRVGFGL